MIWYKLNVFNYDLCYIWPEDEFSIQKAAQILRTFADPAPLFIVERYSAQDDNWGMLIELTENLEEYYGSCAPRCRA